jgi:signal recognition particle subunit SRP54
MKVFQGHFMGFCYVSGNMVMSIEFIFLTPIANCKNVAELDSTNPKLMNESRIMRIARGSGRQVREVMEMLEEYKRLAKVWSKMKGLKIPKKGEMSALSRNMNAQHMSKVLPPQMLKQIGGMGGLQSLMKQMGSTKDMMGMFGGGDS